MSKSTSKSNSKKLTLKKKTVSVLTDRSIIANLNNTKRPIVIISMGCATDFTRQLPTEYQKLLMTDITRPGTDFTKPGKK
ncbi:MAG: hypothetical protein V9F01_01035 [Chitinophagaceae bacterium]